MAWPPDADMPGGGHRWETPSTNEDRQDAKLFQPEIPDDQKIK